MGDNIAEGRREIRVASRSRSLEDLSADVLLEICAAVYELSESLPREESKVSQSDAIRAPAPLQSLSQTSRVFRELAAPKLFKAVKISAKWNETDKALRALENCPRVLRHVLNFTFDVGQMVDDDLKLPAQLDLRLARVLAAMQKLNTLSFQLSEHHTTRFAETFQSEGLNLKSIEALILGPSCSFMASHCPNVKSLRASPRERLWYDRWSDEMLSRMVSDGKQFIIAAGKLPQLKCLEIDWPWTAEHVEAVFESSPSIEKLGLLGFQKESFYTCLPSISRFQHLKALRVADASELEIGFICITCGHYFTGKNGQQNQIRQNKKHKEANEAVALQVFTANSNINELEIGDEFLAVAQRDATDGALLGCKWQRDKNWDADNAIYYPSPNWFQGLTL